MAIIRLVFVLCIFLAVCFAQRPIPESEGGVLIFYDQISTSLSDEQCQFVATHSCGTQKVPLSLINRIRAYNPDFLLLHYELSFGAGDLYNLEGEVWVSDWDSINPHENWFLHSDEGFRCHQMDWDWDFMDPSGAIEGAVPGWKEYWVRRAIRRMRLNNCDGIFSDSHGLPWNMNYYPAGFEPPDDVGLGVHFVLFDQYVMSRFHTDSTEFLFIPNLGQMLTTRDTTDYSTCDGAMIELFSTYDCYNRFEPEDWTLEVDRVLRLANMNKILIFQHDCDYWSPECRTWLIANYFIMKNRRSFINLIIDPDDSWCEFGSLNPFWLAEYQINLGDFDGPIPASAEDMYNATWGVYVRYYERGMVIINNSRSNRNVTFADTFFLVTCTGGGCVWPDGSFDDPVSINFTPVTGFSMPMMTAAIITYTDDPMTVIKSNEKLRNPNLSLSANFSNSALHLFVADNPYIGKVKIRDMMGRVISSHECQNGIISLPGLMAGTYFASAPGLKAAKFTVVE